MEPFGSPVSYIPTHRLLYRGALLLGAFTVVYISNANDGIEWAKPLAPVTERIHHRSKKVPCSEDYNEELNVLTSGCVPKICGRFVSDTIISPLEREALMALAFRGFALDRSKGRDKGYIGATATLDLLSGFNGLKNIFRDAEINFLRGTKNKVSNTIRAIFGLDHNPYITHPTFFSRLTAEEPHTPHDHYWKLHVDKAKHGSVHYTSVIYLSEYGQDFLGGRFIFGDSYQIPFNRTIEPRKGRTSIYTSGSENPHLVERVKFGFRHALILSFTCNESAAIPDISPDFTALF